MRRFNTAGPCFEQWHYMLPPAERLGGLRQVIDEMGWFVLHAPRQTGKTTALMRFAAELTAEGRYASALISLEAGAWSTTDPGAAELSILAAWRSDARAALPEALRPPPWPEAPAGYRLAAALEAWASACQRPLVLFLDEVDALHDEALIAVLRQLRSGFKNRPARFPWSLGLVGLRDVRDYLTEPGRLGSASPFNIKTESMALRDFSRSEVHELYAQHERDTGQAFTEASVALAWALSRGQPWLVNALARACVEAVDGREIDAPDVQRAAERLIQRRDTHLDSLLARLREPRVAEIVREVLLGEGGVDTGSADFQYVADLGLLRRGPEGVEATNPIYREILARELSQRFQDAAPLPPWRRTDGALDMQALLLAFRAWWRENAAVLTEREQAPYREAAAHLALMGFLQRVVNGGGQVRREYAAARGRVDVVVELEGQRFVVELKRVPPQHRGPDSVKRSGLAQLAGYLEALGLEEGWLLIFDQRPGLSWDARLWQEEHVVDGRTLHVLGA